MNTHPYTVHCHICGEPGAATPDCLTAAWTEGTTIAHRDPRICAENLKWKREEEERKRQQEPEFSI